MQIRIISILLLIAMTKYLLLALLMTGVTPVASAKSAVELTLELNKLEQQESACRLHILFKNSTTLMYEQFEIDLVFFDKKNIILKQLTLDAAPLRSNKQVVKPFDIPGLVCEEVGQLLLNDASACRASGKKVKDCLANVRTQSTSKIPFRM